MKKFFVLLIMVSVLIFGGCSENSADVAEQVYADVSETVSQSVAAESTTKAVEETSAETKTETEKKETEVYEIKVTPADEVYDVYPVKLIYPEKQSSGITAEETKAEDSVIKDGYTMSECSAYYPVFSTDNSVFGEAAVQKINDNITEYINGIIKEERKFGEEHNSPEVNENGEAMYYYGAYIQRTVTAGGYWEYSDDCYDINGNILSVYFIDYSYSAGAAHGYETPVSLVFDLRTGERVDFNEIVEDKAGFATAVHRAIYMYLNRNSVKDFEEYFQQNWIESGEELGEQYVQSEEDRMDFYNGRVFLEYNDANSRLISENGCVGYYLAPYEYGCYADGIRLVEIPAGGIMPYLNDKGRSLFEGYVSADSEPLNIIEYRGGKHFSTEHSLEFANREITEEDYDYISEFENAAIEFKRCTGIDYERLAELDNISGLELEGCSDIDFAAIAKIKGITGLILRDCEFDDISPLYGSDVKNIYEADYSSKFKSSENITISQWREFMNAGGEYIDTALIGSETTEYKGLEYTLTTSGIEIQDRDITDTDYEFISLLKGKDFPFLYNIKFTHCGNIDYKKLPKHDDISHVTFQSCNGIDFSVPENVNTEDMLQLGEIDFISCENIDYEGLSGLDSVVRLEFTGCKNIDLEAVAKMKNIKYIDMTGCTYDDITVLYDSNLNSIWVNGKMLWHKDTGYK